MKISHQNNSFAKTAAAVINITMHRHLLIFIIISLQLTLTQQINAATITEQRQQYLDAQKALKAGKIQTFTDLSEKLEEYPLYPYLRYHYIRPRLHKINDTEIKNFITSYPDFIYTDSLKTSWLKQLVKQEKWQIFLDNYTPRKDLKLRCQQLQARIKTNNHTYLLEDTRTLWLTGKSLPPECDAAFARLNKSELMTDELVWERIQNTMETGNTGLVNYLKKSLNQDYKTWATRWLAMHGKPSVATKNPQYADTPIAREILLYGIKRLAKQNINQSLNNWRTLKDNYSFSSAEINEVDLVIAVLAAKNKHPKATELLDSLVQAPDNEEIFHWRLRTALKNKDWQKLYQWTNKEPPELDSIKYRWIYWHGRALEKIGNREKANEILYFWIQGLPAKR